MKYDRDTDAKARARALAEWRRIFDPLGYKNANALIAASHAALLVSVDGRSAFAPDVFADLVDFLEEMPF